jgi:hypothetical protein
MRMKILFTMFKMSFLIMSINICLLSLGKDGPSLAAKEYYAALEKDDSKIADKVLEKNTKVNHDKLAIYKQARTIALCKDNASVTKYLTKRIYSLKKLIKQEICYKDVFIIAGIGLTLVGIIFVAGYANGWNGNTKAHEE